MKEGGSMTKQERIQKRNAFINDFLDKCVYHSWTWERLTALERFNFEDVIADTPLSGTDRQKHETLNTVYRAFLIGTGYNGYTWREPNPEEIPF